MKEKAFLMVSEIFIVTDECYNLLLITQESTKSLDESNKPSGKCQE